MWYTAAFYGSGSAAQFASVFYRVRYCHLRVGPTQCGLSEQVVPSLLPPSRVTGIAVRGWAVERERLRGGRK